MPSPRNTHLTLSDALRVKVNDLEPGAALPSEAELSAEYQVSRGTVRRAMAPLKAEGLIESAPGVGHRRRSDGPAPSVPLHVQVLDTVRDRIAGGEFPVGSQVPSEAELAGDHNVSRPTVRRALAELEAAGVLETVHGKGRIVRRVPNDSATEGQ